MQLESDTQVGRRVGGNGVDGVDDLPQEEYEARFAAYIKNARQVARQDGHPEGPRNAAVLSAQTVRKTQEKREPRETVNRGRRKRKDVTPVRRFNCHTLHVSALELQHLRALLSASAAESEATFKVGAKGVSATARISAVSRVAFAIPDDASGEDDEGTYA